MRSSAPPGVAALTAWSPDAGAGHFAGGILAWLTAVSLCAQAQIESTYQFDSFRLRAAPSPVPAVDLEPNGYAPRYNHANGTYSRLHVATPAPPAPARLFDTLSCILSLFTHRGSLRAVVAFSVSGPLFWRPLRPGLLGRPSTSNLDHHAISF